MRTGRIGIPLAGSGGSCARVPKSPGRTPWPRLLVCADLWLLSAQGTREQVASALARFVTRQTSSPWDFPEDALDAFRARLERDPEVEETLFQLAMDNDEPSVRASTVRLMASVSTRAKSGPSKRVAC